MRNRCALVIMVPGRRRYMARRDRGNPPQGAQISRRALARSLDPERFEALLQRPVVAIEKAEALEGPFPLVVIGQGLYYESPVLLRH